MDMLDDFEATALNDPLADLDRLLELLSERYGVTTDAGPGSMGGNATYPAAADSVRETASRTAQQQSG